MADKGRTELFGKMSEALEIIESCQEFAALIPEVRTNLVYAPLKAREPRDVLGIEGRITVIKDKPQAAGRPKFGASSHMARLIIEIQKFEPSIRAGINFAARPEFLAWLEKYCLTKGWVFTGVDRSREPEKIAQKEEASMPWKVKEAVRKAGGLVPKIFYEANAAGKEDITVLLGKDPIEVASEACSLARAYVQSLQSAPKIGKIDFYTFASFLLKRLGKKDRSVIVPPLTGIDAGVIDIGNDRVLIIAEDPIFSIPGQPLEMFGWYTVHIGASDVAVMGVKPRYMTYTLLMPPQTGNREFRTIVDTIHRTALELEIAIVGGHTGYYPGFASPTIGGITVFAFAHKDSYITPAEAKAGDEIILTKGPAIETAGILAALREKELLEKYPSSLVNRAKALCLQMTVIKDALTAMEAGGVTAMHDATEGGVIGGLFEIANASCVGMEVDENLFIYPEEVKMVCDAFEIDPVAAIAEGSLLITARPTYGQKIINRLKASNIQASIIGAVMKNPKRRILKRRDGSIVSLAIPFQDPFWPAFFKGLESPSFSR